MKLLLNSILFNYSYYLASIVRSFSIDCLENAAKNGFVVIITKILLWMRAGSITSRVYYYISEQRWGTATIPTSEKSDAIKIMKIIDEQQFSNRWQCIFFNFRLPMALSWVRSITFGSVYNRQLWTIGWNKKKKKNKSLHNKHHDIMITSPLVLFFEFSMLSSPKNSSILDFWVNLIVS